MSSVVVGIAGAARHGKDTAARILIERLGFVRLAYGDAMKCGLLAVDPYITWKMTWRGPRLVRLSEVIAEFGWDEAKRRYPEVRRSMQRYGTEGGRDIHGYECWLRPVAQCIDSQPGRYVITDVRFDNEADVVHDRGGVVCRVVRPGYNNLTAQHVSEALPSSCVDHDILNDGTSAQLQTRVMQYVVRCFPGAFDNAPQPALQ
jgi:hypothetical protein